MSRLFILFILLLTGMAAYLLFEPPREPDLLDLVPGDSYAVLDWKKPADFFNYFHGGPLEKALTGFDRSGIYRVLDFPRSRGELIEEWLGLAEEITSSQIFKTIYNNRIVLALLPVSEGNSGENPGLSNNIVLLTEIDDGLRDVINGLGKTEQQQILKPLIHQGIPVNRVLLAGGKTIYFATDRGENILIIALAAAPVKECIDLAFAGIIGKKGGITQNNAYASLQAKATGEDDSLFFINAAGVSFLRQHRFFFRLDDNSSIADFLFHGLEYGGFFYRKQGDTHKITSILNFNPLAADSLLPVQLRRSSVRNELIGRIPSDTQFYLWSNWLDIHGWWLAGQDSIRVDARQWRKRLASFIQENSGMEITDFLRNYGDQVEFAVKEFRHAGFLPVPVVYLSVELTDKRKVKKFFDSALASFSVHHVKINDFPVVSVSLADGLMQPAYGMFNNFFVFADSKEQIKEMLEIENKLVYSPDFLALGMDLKQDNNLMFFARNEQLNKAAKEILLWLGDFDNGNGAGWVNKEVIDYIAIPGLDIFSLFKAGSLCLSMGKKDMIMQVSFLIEDDGFK